jgi:hypothetical protein
VRENYSLPKVLKEQMSNSRFMTNTEVEEEKRKRIEFQKRRAHLKEKIKTLEHFGSFLINDLNKLEGEKSDRREFSLSKIGSVQKINNSRLNLHKKAS